MQIGATGIVTNRCDTTTGQAGRLASTGLWPAFQDGHQGLSLDQHVNGSGWAKELLQQLHVVHSGTVRTGSTTHSRNPTQMAENIFLVGRHEMFTTKPRGLQDLRDINNDCSLSWNCDGKISPRGPCENHVLRTGLNACLTFRLSLDRISTTTTALVGNSGCHLRWHGARTRDRDPMQISTQTSNVATLETTPCVC